MENDLKICYGLLDSTDGIEHDGMRRLVRNLNFAFDSIMMPVVEKTPMDMLRYVADETGYTHLVVLDSGTILANSDKLRKSLYHLCESDWLVAGHIMSRQTDHYPYLHHQAYVVNVENWRRFGRPDFGDSTQTPMTLPAAWKSNECVHDDYTPVWLKPHPGVTVNVEKVKFGWKMIATSLEHGLMVPNLPVDARSSRIYMYPDDNAEQIVEMVSAMRRGESIDIDLVPNESQKRFLRNQQWAMENDSNVVFIFNTGDSQLNMGGSAPPGALWASASGFKQFAEWHYRGMLPDVEINTYDYNARSLDVWRAINSGWDGTDLYSFLKARYADCDDEDLYCWGNKLDYESPQAASDRQELLLHDLVGSRDAFVDAWMRYRELTHRYHHVNLIEQPTMLAGLMSPGRHHYVWVNNIFYFNRSLRKYGMEYVHDRLVEFVTAIMDTGVDNHIIGQGASLYFFDEARHLRDRLIANPDPVYQCQFDFSTPGVRRWAGHPLPY